VLLWLNFVLQPCCSTHCTLVRQRLYTLVHYAHGKEFHNGLMESYNGHHFFLLSTVTGTLVSRALGCTDLLRYS
jgi:hypothetical protein